MGMAETTMDVTGTSTTGTLEVIGTGYSGHLNIFAADYPSGLAGPLGSSNYFDAWGSYDVTYKAEAVWGSLVGKGTVLNASIQASSNSYASFETKYYQDFDVTGYGTFEGLVGAYVEGDDGAEMNLGTGGHDRSIAVTHYPNCYATALHADGTSGAYEIQSYTVVGEDIFNLNLYNIGPDIEAESSITVSGTAGDAWMSLGYSKNSTDLGEISHAGPAGSIGYCGPDLGNVGGTNVYVDAGSGDYSHYVYGEDYLDFEGGEYPGGGEFVLVGTFDDGMHATPWAQAD